MLPLYLKHFSLKQLIQSALKEDIKHGDLTTKALIPTSKSIQSLIIAQQQGIIAGLPLIRLIYHQLDKRIRVKLYSQDGNRVKKNKKLALVSGPARSILIGERTVLNFLQRLSGIASHTDKFARKLKGYRTRLLDTRKTIPSWRYLDKYAVSIGGGKNHRLGLYDAILVKSNHLKTLGYPIKSNLISETIKKLRRIYQYKHSIEIEVSNFKELRSAMNNRPDIIMLDNMSFKQIKESIVFVRRFPPPRPLLEASGGVTLENITSIARTNIDFISVGALTHSAPALDLALKVIN